MTRRETIALNVTVVGIVAITGCRALDSQYLKTDQEKAEDDA